VNRWDWTPSNLEAYVSELGSQIREIGQRRIIWFPKSEIDEDYRRGGDSGYPECCIEFYSCAWTYCPVDTWVRRAYFALLETVSRGYILCPRCLRGALGESSRRVADPEMMVDKLVRQRELRIRAFQYRPYMRLEDRCRDMRSRRDRSTILRAAV
jgi:hypothetical protein